jgi:hypothetical protein
LLSDRHYSFFGTVLSSPVAFDGLREIEVDGLVQDGIVLRFGDVPSALQNVVWSSPFIAIDQSGAALIEIPVIGRFLVRDGRDILFSEVAGATVATIQSAIVSFVAGAILHQRSTLPLHASCVELEGKVVAIAGPSGHGKSTLAAALVRQGGALITDDIAVVRWLHGAPHVEPGANGLRLWPDAADAAGCIDENWAPVRQGHRKRVYLAPAGSGDPRRLEAILRLAIEDDSLEPGVRRLSGLSAIVPMRNLVYRANLGTHLGRQAALFVDLSRLSDCVPIFEFRRPWALSQLGIAVDMVREVLSDLAVTT